MFDKLRALITKQKLHEFDLLNPRFKNVSGYSFPVYHCKNCGKELSLELWQMMNLPWNMKIGCK